jgi:transcriptional regulator with XRE-family HTH domain
MLQKLRNKSGLTLRALQELSGVPNPVISAIENGKRRCGAVVAKKLASIIFGSLECPERSEFLYAAAATIKARGAIEDSQLYPPAVLDVVASKLKRMRIKDRDILAAHVHDAEKDKYDLLIVLKGGRRLAVAVTIKNAP